MDFKVLIKNLVRQNWLVSILVSTILFIFVLLFVGANIRTVTVTLLTMTRLLVMGYFHIWLLSTYHRVKPLLPVKKFRLLRYGWGMLAGILLLGATAPVMQAVAEKGQPNLLHDYRLNIISIIVQSFALNLMIIVLQDLMILQHEKNNTDLENARLKAANLESANLLLRQQIQPHFLFNALSMLKALYKIDVPSGENYLAHLVSFLRASLANSQARLARLSDEIALCRDYLEMMDIRFGKALHCIIDIPAEVLQNGRVPFFSIQSLIENAIKHNEVKEASPLVINICYKDGCIVTENNVQLRTNVDFSTGKGLINLAERYRILSGDEIIIQQSAAAFSVSIKVLYDENSDHRR